MRSAARLLGLRSPLVFPTASELWIVPRGDYFFLIGAGTRQDEKTGGRDEIRSILGTVRIEQQASNESR